MLCRRMVFSWVLVFGLVTGVVAVVEPVARAERATTQGPHRPLWDAAITKGGSAWVLPEELVVDPGGHRVFALLSTSDPAAVYDVPSVIAFHAATGRALWRWRSTTARIDDIDVAPGGRRVYLAGEGKGGLSRLIALRAGTGKVLWSVARRGRGWQVVTASPDGRNLFVGGLRPRTEAHRESRSVVAAYAAGTGKLRWHTPFGSRYYSSYVESISSTRDRRTLIVGIAVESSKAQQCPAAAAANLRAADGRVEWTTVLAQMPGCGGVMQLQVTDAIVVLPWYGDRGPRALPETHVAGLRLADGSVAWSRRLAASASVGQVSPAGRIFVSAQARSEKLGARLLALDVGTGKTLWSRSLTLQGTPVPSPNGRRVYIAGTVVRKGGAGAAVVGAWAASDGHPMWRSAPYRGPLKDPAGDRVAGTSWSEVAIGKGGNRVFTTGYNAIGYPGEEWSRTIPVFAAYAA